MCGTPCVGNHTLTLAAMNMSFFYYRHERASHCAYCLLKGNPLPPKKRVKQKRLAYFIGGKLAKKVS